MKSAALVAVSLLAGIAIAYVFPRISNQSAIRIAKRKLQAHLLELRLVSDEPALMWRAQKDFLAANGRYLAAMLRPALVLGPLFVLMLLHLEPFFGSRSPAVGESVLVSARLAGDDSKAPELRSGPNLRVETPVVRVASTNEVFWRIRAVAPADETVRLTLGTAAVEKRVVTGREAVYLSPERVGSWWKWLVQGGELPIADQAVDSIRIDYPQASIRLFGIEAHWTVWFILISMLAAFLSTRVMGVAL
jgi:hypothetical protein